MTEPHPLFLPNDDDEEYPEVVAIHVTRHDSDGQKYCPRLFEAGELQGLDDLYANFGGGLYELISRDSRKKISARRRYKIDGKPKPLTGPEPEPERPPFVTPAQPAATGGAVMPLLLTLAPLVLEWIKSNAALQRETANQQTNMLMAMMNRDSENARAHAATMQALHDRHAAGQSDLLRAVLERANSSDPSELLTRGLEMGVNLVAGQREGTDDAESSIKDLVEGMQSGAEVLKTLKETTGPGGIPAQQRSRPIAAPPQQRPPQQRPPSAPPEPSQAANQ